MGISFDSLDEENSINMWSNNRDLLDLIEQHYEKEHLLRQTMASSAITTIPTYSTLNKEDSEVVSQIDTTIVQ
jgi:hypothetical protein